MKVAVIQYTDLPTECDGIKQNLYDLTEFRLQVPGKHEFDLFPASNFSSALDSLTEYDWAVMVATGTYLYNSDITFDTIQHGIDHGAPMVCHIIAHESYPYASTQWLAVDLTRWRSIGSPRFEIESKLDLQAPVVAHSLPGKLLSSKVLRGAHKPQLLRAANKVATFELDPHQFGATVIAEFLAAGYPIVGVPSLIDQQKFHSYPELFHESIAQMIKDPEFDTIKHESLQPFHDALQKLRKNLDIGYYPINTEKLPDQSVSIPLDCFAGVCGGIKPAWITGADYFESGSKVLLFDISPAAIAYQKYLLQHWDGDVYSLEYLHQEFQSNNPGYESQYFKHMGLAQNLQWCFDHRPDLVTEFRRRWNKYRTHDFRFEQLDLFDPSSARRVADWVNQSRLGAYIWYSNSFWMDYLMFYASAYRCNQIEQYFKGIVQAYANIPVVWDHVATN